MKTTLILAILISGFAWAAKKNPDVRQSKKAVDEKYLKSLTSDEPAGKTISQDIHSSQSRAEQMESKKSRQFQEERPKVRE